LLGKIPVEWENMAVGVSAAHRIRGGLMIKVASYIVTIDTCI
jgi:hypothetical protein